MICMVTPFVSKISNFTKLTDNDLTELKRFDRPKRSFAAGNNLLHDGQDSPKAYILVDGWVISYKVLRGGGRQIVNFQIPGDFLGLRSILFRCSDHNLESLTNISAVELCAPDLLATVKTSPRIAVAVMWALSADEAIIVERLVSLGRRDATERVAHFFLELSARLRMVGRATKDGYACPLSQYHLADALGLSAVHINRVLRQLREDNLMTFRSGKVTFNDYDRLVNFVDFDTSYLDHQGILTEQAETRATYK